MSNGQQTHSGNKRQCSVMAYVYKLKTRMQLAKTNTKLAKKNNTTSSFYTIYIIWFVWKPVCGRFGLWPFRSVAFSICGRFGLWPSWPETFRIIPECFNIGRKNQNTFSHRCECIIFYCVRFKRHPWLCWSFHKVQLRLWQIHVGCNYSSMSVDF